MGGAAYINGTLTLTDGIIQSTSTNILGLNKGATTTIGSSNSFIDGPMAHTIAAGGSTALNFPIGKTIYDWRPAVLTVNQSDPTPVTYTAEVFNSSARALGYTLPATVDTISSVRYWKIDRENVANFNNATVRLYYGSDDGVTDYTNLTVVKTHGSGTIWYNIGGTATGNNIGSILSGTFTQFSKFTLGNLIGGTNPLPIELLSFNAACNNEKINISWATASEKNNSRFEAQRSMDANNFSTIAKVSGKGNSTIEQDYQITDNDPLEGENYYRLKTVDNSGNADYSNIVAINNCAASALKIIPNPAKNDFTVNFYSSTIQNYELKIMNSFGQVVYNQALKSTKGYNQIKLSPSLSSGLYIVKLFGNETEVSAKLAVDR